MLTAAAMTYVAALLGTVLQLARLILMARGNRAAMTDNTREIILRVLREISESGIYSHMAIRGALDKYRYLPKRDRAFITLCAREPSSV